MPLKTEAINKKAFLGEQLLAAGAISAQQLAIALQQQSRTGELLGEVLHKLGFLSSHDLSLALANQFGTEHVDLETLEISPECLSIITEEYARERKIVPASLVSGVLTVVMANMYDVLTISEIESRFNVTVHAVSSSHEAILKAIVRLYEHPSSIEESIEECVGIASAELNESDPLSKGTEEAPIIRLVDLLLTNCVRKEATDLHIEPEQQLVRTRYRVDGILHLGNALPRKILPSVVARLKIMAGANIAESRLPQDGRITFNVDKRPIDVRASFFPTLFGENVVLRFLDKSKLLQGLHQLGFSEQNFVTFKEALGRPYGMILVTGPTGSGKTTTLYSALNFMNSLEKNIMTIEDPVEYEIPLIRQSQVNTKAGLTFAAGLRAFLRQDPDVILVGEIRDQETAEMATRAALTGHLLLATLHTNNAAGAIPRLIEMGQSPHILASSLILVVAQRLYRKLCARCKEPHSPDDWQLEKLGLSSSSHVYFRGRGCEACNHTGYRGRAAIYELLRVTQQIQPLILDRASHRQIEQVAEEQGLKTLRADAAQKVIDGLTTVEEAQRLTFEG